MKRIVRLLPMFCIGAMTLLLSSCGGSGSSGGSECYENSDGYYESSDDQESRSSQVTYQDENVNFQSPMDVWYYLSGKSFHGTDGEGELVINQNTLWIEGQTVSNMVRIRDFDHHTAFFEVMLNDGSELTFFLNATGGAITDGTSTFVLK